MVEKKFSSIYHSEKTRSIRSKKNFLLPYTGSKKFFCSIIRGQKNFLLPYTGLEKIFLP